ncbi:MAG: hypothetical protein CO096_17460 [Armatimonadetes bacterium CG_4_9_14_3_um_filter_66_14]|nr:MAG: hypothetical protein COS65_28990 [Armatimonadetes bacterium CG06_land_8_20_14_3_00_66_21]PJB66185.1 MAG: hypothetical protein CO096_17460 [Armatimonadetes bacterium CG_4_9_14_3_um_filter_66_14]
MLAAQDAIAPTETDRTREQQALEAALAEADDVIREAKRRLRGLLRPAELEVVLTAYQLDAPLTRMTREFLASRLRNLGSVSAAQTNPDAQLPADLLQRAAAALTEIESHRPAAGSSLADRKTAVAHRNEVLDEVNLLRRRAYFHLCFVLPDMDDDPRLDAYGFGAQRSRGAVKPEPQPAQPTG